MNELPSIGSLNQQIVIQTGTESKSTSGTPTLSWSTFATLWAKIEYAGGSEQIEGGKIISTDTVFFTTRYTAGILPKMRILFNSEIFNIKSPPDQLGRQRFIKIKTERET